jgi:hypothetical protein
MSPDKTISDDGDFATVWNELFLAEQARIVRLLVERVMSRRTRSRCASERRDW